MFFYASKFLMFLIQPLIWIIVIITIGLFDKDKKRARRLFILAFLLLVTFTNPFLINTLYNNWEPAPKTYSSLDHYEVIIVLGGYSNSTQEPLDRVHFVKGADRILHAIEIYKLGKANALLLSGGTSRVLGEKISEATSVYPFLKNMGIPEKAILLESTSRNTHENAKYTADIINEKYPGGTFLLITSAFHMKRAEACFQKEGLDVITFPTDYYGNEFYWTPGNIIVPKSNAFMLWHILIKEWIGIVAYKITGYI